MLLFFFFLITWLNAVIFTSVWHSALFSQQFPRQSATQQNISILFFLMAEAVSAPLAELGAKFKFLLENDNLKPSLSTGIIPMHGLPLALVSVEDEAQTGRMYLLYIISLLQTFWSYWGFLDFLCRIDFCCTNTIYKPPTVFFYVRKGSITFFKEIELTKKVKKSRPYKLCFVCYHSALLCTLVACKMLWYIEMTTPDKIVGFLERWWRSQNPEKVCMATWASVGNTYSHVLF